MFQKKEIQGRAIHARDIWSPWAVGQGKEKEEAIRGESGAIIAQGDVQRRDFSGRKNKGGSRYANLPDVTGWADVSNQIKDFDALGGKKAARKKQPQKKKKTWRRRAAYLVKSATSNSRPTKREGTISLNSSLQMDETEDLKKSGREFGKIINSRGSIHSGWSVG